MSTDFVWRCNALDCRSQVKNRAVVTTCSHLFCLPCAETQGLAVSNNGVRICPACNQQLVNEDDAVITQLEPSEDYKTSVLSGLHPSIIMECAGRGLSFYSYQVTSEITYQSYMAASLTEKYSAVNDQLDNIIAQANGQIKKLQDALKESHAQNAEIEKKNWELQQAFKTKAKGLQDLNKKYNAMRSEQMKGQVIDAASDDAERVLNTVTGNRFLARPLGPTYGGGFSQHHRPTSDNSFQRGHQMVPDPVWSSQRPPGLDYASRTQEVRATPSTTRTRLPMGINRAPGVFTADGMAGIHESSMSSARAKMFGNPSLAGYGMTAGMKMSQQPLVRTGSSRIGRASRPADLPIR